MRWYTVGIIVYVQYKTYSRSGEDQVFPPDLLRQDRDDAKCTMFHMELSGYNVSGNVMYRIID